MGLGDVLGFAATALDPRVLALSDSQVADIVLNRWMLLLPIAWAGHFAHWTPKLEFTCTDQKPLVPFPRLTLVRSSMPIDYYWSRKDHGLRWRKFGHILWQLGGKSC